MAADRRTFYWADLSQLRRRDSLQLFTHWEMRFIRKHLPPILHNAAGGIITALVLSVAGIIVLSPKVRAVLAPMGRKIELNVPFWVIVVLAIFAIIASVQVIRPAAVASRCGNIRLFRSLSSDERTILIRLAESEFGLSEWELSEAVPVMPQQFLHFIDRLVGELRLVDRTEPSNGGAFWSLSAKGRQVAAANGLFPRVVDC